MTSPQNIYETWPPKKSESIRCVFWNCGGFPVKPGDAKDLDIRQALLKMDPDLAGLAETNIAWHNIPAQHRLHERTWGWFEKLKITTSYPTKFPTVTSLLAGGTATFAINGAVHRVARSDIDQHGLGRWSSISLQGKKTISIRMVSAYRCVRNLKGPLSVWNQQRYLLDQASRFQDPIDCFDDDLLKALEEWLQAGEQIVLGIDLNEDIRTAKFVMRLRAIGITEVMHHKFCPQLPNTYSRGSTPIDGLFVSRSLLESNCGYTEIICDHRMLWIDIPYSIALGFTPDQIASINPTRLKLLDPRVVTNYQNILRKILQKHSVLEKLIDLCKRLDGKGTMSYQQVQAFTKIDNIRTQAIKSANNKCRKLRMGAVPFSPLVSNAGRKVQAWSLLVKKKSGKKLESRHLRRKLKEADIQVNLHELTLHQAQTELRAAWTFYNSIKKRAATERVTWIEELASARAEAGNISVSQEIRNILTREKQRRDARLIKRANQDLGRASLTAVEQWTGGVWKEITSKEEIEDALCTELEGRFNQAKDTPFLSQDILDDIGFWAEGPAASDILNGTYVPHDDSDPWISKLLPHLKYAFPPQDFPLEWTEDEHTAGWKNVKEKTSAGRSGITIPHMKANSLDPTLCHIDTLMAWIPFRFGLSLDRWKHGIDVMLEKKKGVRQINKLRAILLFEADFNQNNKRLGKLMLAQAEKFGAVAPEQFGSRNKRSAVDQSLNKVLTFDSWRLERKCGALCSNDAKSCYDRIVHNFASICMQRVRVPLPPIQSMFKTIQSLKHYIRTAYGDSTRFFEGTHQSYPIQGVGQGNGAGPQIWALISTPLMNMLRHEGYGATFLSPITQTQTMLMGFGFVDDTDLVVSAADIQSARDAAEKLQGAITAWEGGLRVTGGAIEPTKSFWYPVDFLWEDGIPKYKSVEQCNVSEIKVRDHSGTHLPLQCLEPDSAERTLGIRLAPDGNMGEQYRYMEDIARSWIARLKASHLPRALSRQALLSTIMKSLEYPLPVTTLSRKQCARLSSILTSGILPRIGVVKTFPKALVHGPIQYFGLEIPDLFIEQGIAHINRLVRFSTCRNHPTSQLLRHVFEVARVTLGCNGNILQLPWHKFHTLLPECWLKSTWEFCQMFNIEIKDDTPGLVGHRENDALLIPLFAQEGFSCGELRLLNTCRLYCKVSWLSEVCTGDGKRLLPSIADGHGCYISKLQYPNQGFPSRHAWSLWKKALVSLVYPSGMVKFCLGAWIDPPSPWKYDEPKETLYFDDGVDKFTFSKMSRARSRRIYAKFCNKQITINIPNSATPASVHKRGDHWVMTGYAPCLAPTVTQKSTFGSFLYQIFPKDAQWVLTSFTVSGNWDNWASDPGKLIAVSDGSFKDGHGTAAFILKSELGHKIEGHVVTPGPAAVQSAYRSELAGIYAISAFAYSLSKYYGVPGHITAACDGKSALHQASYRSDSTNPSSPNYDIIMAIRHFVAETKWDWQWHHVRGHQDTKGSEPLNEWEILNVEMDKQAKWYWNESKDLVKQETVIVGEPWPVVCDTIKMCSDVPRNLRLYCTSKDAAEYWKNKNRITTNVNWQAIGGALRPLPWSRRIWITKHVTGFCATGNNMLRRKERDTDRCPRCEQTENPEHVWKCRTEATQQIWDTKVLELRQWLLSENSNPLMVHGIIQHLQAWRCDSTTESTTNPKLQHVFAEQTKAGWKNFFEGFHDLQWEREHGEYLAKINSTKSPRRWTIALIRKLWDVAWDLWEHRNGILHDREQSILIDLLNKQVQDQIRLGKAGLDKASVQLFSLPEQALLGKPTYIKQQWLARVTLAREKFLSVQSLGTTYNKERDLMKRWLKGT